jgi:hypothetical protein
MGRTQRMKQIRKISGSTAAQHGIAIRKTWKPPLWRRIIGIVFPSFITRWKERMEARHKAAIAGAEKKVRNSLKA